jgi:hypothetical protein
MSAKQKLKELYELKLLIQSKNKERITHQKIWKESSKKVRSLSQEIQIINKKIIDEI